MYGQFAQHLSMIFKILGKALQHFVLLSDSKLIWKKMPVKALCSSLRFKIALVPAW